ncbi:unnamed protein product [Darwinula stevensoni]|uniref:Uncharacterized protein n=1 Tax=Darwinula stevensoni TaxID=69355 RepID=A0A7R8XEW3_9CRUS|nr:unnamed protein product [Darwinula stevensoni]CAG0894391.1 unnamed protein product [Darwinula stevensoni]
MDHKGLWEPEIPEKMERYRIKEVGDNIRGWALIFHHEMFDPKLRLPPRPGVQIDVDNLRRVFKNRGFVVKEYKDFSYESMKQELRKIAHSQELTDHDCLILCFLSHGKEGGILYTNNKEFNEEELWSSFYGSECKALLHKPKLFFIQACRGGNFDSGEKGNVISNDGKGDTHDGIEQKDYEYHLPTHANILIAHATYEGHVAWKNEDLGSYYIHTLCQVFEKHSETLDVMRMLTMVAGVMAKSFQSKNPDTKYHEKKQMPTIRSTLTGELCLKPKAQA